MMGTLSFEAVESICLPNCTLRLCAASQVGDELGGAHPTTPLDGPCCGSHPAFHQQAQCQVQAVWSMGSFSWTVYTIANYPFPAAPAAHRKRSLRPRCPTPPRVVLAVHHMRSTTPWVARVHDAFRDGCRGVRFAGGVRSVMVDSVGVCTCVVSRVIYSARWLLRRPWFCPPRFCRRFLPFPGPPLLSTVCRRGPSGGPLGAESPRRRRPTILRCRGPRVGSLGARSPARTDRSKECLRGPGGGPLGAGSPGHRQAMMLRCRGPRVGPLGARSPDVH